MGVLGKYWKKLTQEAPCIQDSPLLFFQIFFVCRLLSTFFVHVISFSFFVCKNLWPDSLPLYSPVSLPFLLSFCRQSSRSSRSRREKGKARGLVTLLYACCIVSSFVASSVVFPGCHVCTPPYPLPARQRKHRNLCMSDFGPIGS